METILEYTKNNRQVSARHSNYPNIRLPPVRASGDRTSRKKNKYPRSGWSIQHQMDEDRRAELLIVTLLFSSLARWWTGAQQAGAETAGTWRRSGRDALRVQVVAPA